MKPCILLVEDNPVNQIVVRKMLLQLGCEVQVVENGALAVDAVQQTAYDMVLMDCQMPVMDGFEATQLIRQTMCARELPIVAITANVTPDDYHRCFDVGMDDFLAKPVGLDRFREVLGRWLPRDRWHVETDLAEEA